VLVVSIATYGALSNMDGFIRVSNDGTRLEQADGRPFFFAGANCYYLLVRMLDQESKQQPLEVSLGQLWRRHLAGRFKLSPSFQCVIWLPAPHYT
jgi:hypothetical protein